MTTLQEQIIEELRHQGYLVCIFTPEELRGADAGQVEELMIERANCAIDDLATEDNINDDIGVLI